MKKVLPIIMFDELKEIENLKQGCSKAFENIYMRYSGKLYNFILSISKGDEYLAEEMVQSAFVKLWEVRAQIDSNKSIHSYLSTIARNMLYNSYKRQTVEYLYQEFILKDGVIYDQYHEQEIYKRSLDEYVDKLIETLPPSRKKIFILRRKNDLSTREIAEIMDISVSTVETQLSIATKYMRQMFEKNWDKLFVLIIAFMLN